MGFSDRNVVSKIPLAVLPVGLIFIIVGLATTSWYTKIDSDTGEVYRSYGLWRYCREEQCAGYPLVPDWWGATRAFMIIGMLSAASGICLFVLSIAKSELQFLKIVAIFPPFVAGLCVVIGVSVFAGKYLELNEPLQHENLSWSFILSIVGGVVSIFAGIIWILGIVIERKSRD